MKQRLVYHRDTQSWTLQVWMSFGIAITACLAGVLQLPSQDLDRAFLAIGLLFCLFAAFAVAKTTRDNQHGQVDTAGWIIVVWTAFGGALALTAWGLWRMTIVDWQKGYMVVSWLFLISSTFTLAKTIRDKHDANLAEMQDTGETRPA